MPTISLGQDSDSEESVPTDIVKLKDGSLYRGTILELVAGEHVDLRLPSGEVKRFAMQDVTYAGAAAAQPGQRPRGRSNARPLVTIDSEEAQVHFEGTTPNIDFHIRTSEAEVSGGGWVGGGGGFVYEGNVRGYTHICSAPCDATLPAGRHRLALSLEGRKPIEASEPVEISGPSTVRGTYESYRGLRVAGWLLFGTTLTGGLVMMTLGLTAKGQDCSQQAITGSCVDAIVPDQGLVYGGLTIALVGSALGLVMALHHDDVSIEVLHDQSLLRPRLLAGREAVPAPSAWVPHGLGLKVRLW